MILYQLHFKRNAQTNRQIILNMLAAFLKMKNIWKVEHTLPRLSSVFARMIYQWLEMDSPMLVGNHKFSFISATVSESTSFSGDGFHRWSIKRSWKPSKTGWSIERSMFGCFCFRNWQQNQWRWAQRKFNCHDRTAWLGWIWWGIDFLDLHPRTIKNLFLG